MSPPSSGRIQENPFWTYIFIALFSAALTLQTAIHYFIDIATHQWLCHGTYGELEQQWGLSVRTLINWGLCRQNGVIELSPPQFCCHVPNLCQIRTVCFAFPAAASENPPQQLWDQLPYVRLVKSLLMIKSSPGSRLTLKSLTSLRRSCTMLREKMCILWPV